MKLRVCSCVVVALLLSIGSIASAGVEIQRQPPVVKNRSFNPKRPPAEMPPLKPGEAAVCESKYACQVQIEVEINQTGDEKPTCTITGVQAQISLNVVVWLPSDTTAKIKSHEDGHRQISELFYADAEKVARQIGEKYIGRALDVKGIEQADTRPAIQRAANEFCQEYLGTIEVPSEKVQKKYDQLTDHGRNRVPEKEAIKQATEEAK